MRWILLLFVVVPLVELYLLLWLSTLIGFWPTVVMVLVTGLLGGSLAKREGLKVWRSWRAALSEFRTPAEGVIDGLLVLLGGALLITPGVLTDACGLLLLLPPTRRLVAARIRKAVDERIQRGQLNVQTQLHVVDLADLGDELGRSPLRRVHDDAPVVETSGEVVSGSGESAKLER